MRNTIRCCISCILPCGSLDVIRIVHCNGHVEEITGTIRACEVMKANPKHVLKKPSSRPVSDSDDGGVVPKIVIVPPDAELQRGKIYFLMPLPPAATTPAQKTTTRSASALNKNKKKKRKKDSEKEKEKENTPNSASISLTNVMVSDRYLSEILSEKLSTQRDKRRGRTAVWRPHLESISEFPTDL